MQNKGYYTLHCWKSFKVTDVGNNRKHVCDFLLVINTDILARTVPKLSQSLNIGHWGFEPSLGA